MGRDARMEERKEEHEKNAMAEKKNKTVVRTIHSHRVGSITFGCVLVIFGSLFLAHIMVPALTYELIFHLWPCIFIILGIEILVANIRGNREFIYDIPAVIMMILLTLFAMGMAVTDYCMQQAVLYPYYPYY